MAVASGVRARKRELERAEPALPKAARDHKKKIVLNQLGEAERVMARIDRIASMQLAPRGGK